jgi:hypothetical protein
LRQIEETKDGGVHWVPKSIQTFDPPEEGHTLYNDDRAAYVADDTGITRLGVLPSRKLLKAVMDELGVFEYVAASPVRSSAGLYWVNKAEMIGILMSMTSVTTTPILPLKLIAARRGQNCLEQLLPTRSVSTRARP